MDEERLLRPGANFTTRGDLKYARAVHLANELRGRIDEWAAAETLLARPHQVDDHTVEFRLVLRREPPVDEWGLVLGDVLHNLRGMLDNVVWAMATLDGAVPQRPTRVAFPVTANETEWRRQAAGMESVPDDLLARIRALQPWATDASRDESILGVLNRLSNIDKHRGLIDSALHLKRILIGGFRVNEMPFQAKEGTVSYETRQTPVALVDDAVLSTVRSSTSPLIADPAYLARVDTQFAVVDGDERILFLDMFLADALSGAREWLDRLYGGEFHALQQIAARVAGPATVTFGFRGPDGTLRITQLPMEAPEAEPSELTE